MSLSKYRIQQIETAAKILAKNQPVFDSLERWVERVFESSSFAKLEYAYEIHEALQRAYGQIPVPAQVNCLFSGDYGNLETLQLLQLSTHEQMMLNRN